MDCSSEQDAGWQIAQDSLVIQPHCTNKYRETQEALVKWTLFPLGPQQVTDLFSYKKKEKNLPKQVHTKIQNVDFSIISIQDISTSLEV